MSISGLVLSVSTIVDRAEPLVFVARDSVPTCQSQDVFAKPKRMNWISETLQKGAHICLTRDLGFHYSQWLSLTCGEVMMAAVADFHIRLVVFL